VTVDVLLVEDARLLLETTHRFLSAHGLSVATCDSPFGIGAAIVERKPSARDARRAGVGHRG